MKPVQSLKSETLRCRTSFSSKMASKYVSIPLLPSFWGAFNALKAAREGLEQQSGRLVANHLKLESLLLS